MRLGEDSGAAVPGAVERPKPPLWLIFSITATGILSSTMLSPALLDILRDLDLPTSKAGLIVASGTLPGIVVAPLIGLLADRWGRRRVLVPCLSIFGGAGMLAAVAPTFELLIVARLLQGVGSAGLINLAVVLIGDNWDGAERTRLVGRNSAMLTASLAVFPPIGGLLTNLGGWRLAFAPYTLGIVTAIVVARRLPEYRPGGDDQFLDQLRSARRVARTPIVLATLLIGFVIFFLIFGLFLTTLPVHLGEEFGLSAGWRGLVIAAPAIPSTMMAFNLGRLRVRFGVQPLLVLASCLFVAAFVLIGVASSLAIVIVGAVLYGVGEGVFIPSLQDVAATSAGPIHRGAVVAIWVGSARAGQTVGPLVASNLVDATSASTTFLLGACVATLMCGAVIAGPIRDSRLVTPVVPAPA